MEVSQRERPARRLLMDPVAEPADRRVVAIQIGRAPRSDSRVVSVCHLGLPVVVEMPPLLEDGTPFPTRYWLTCPLAVKRVSRVESEGGVKAMDARSVRDPAFGARLQAAHRRYATMRDSEVPASARHRPAGGVAGARKGVKCIHAHYADHRSGNDNPVGEWAAPLVEPLDCEVPCVLESPEGPVANPEWREP
ncbi:MAG: DUF501 domain-containing protein [bacterium]|nr:DUF501 domain-containing protein [bacterium]